MSKVDVSIVVVCMNNLKNLYPCLNSIKEQTHKVSYEVLVTAYLFSRENLIKVCNDFPWVKFIESNEIRGFSENNNLALKQARGKYCFVLNDDTEMKMPVVDMLVDTIEKLPEDVAFISPATYFGNGQLQSCGRPPHTTWTYIKGMFHLWCEQKSRSKYVNQNGVFQSYDVVGAAFMIKTAIFKELGWFDEKFFFCPEDIALSTFANRKGYKAYVNADIHLIHYEGMSGGTSVSPVKTATEPAATKGALMFYSHNNQVLYFFLALLVSLKCIIRYCNRYCKYLIFHQQSDYLYMLVNRNVLCSVYTRNTPKQIFSEYYSKLK